MNFGTPVPLLLGIILIVGAVALFFLDRLKPGYERDSDKVYAILSLISGIFLLGNLTMELIPAFQQIIMVGMFITLMVQNINARVPRDKRVAQTGGYDGPDGYRPSRPDRPAYRPDARANVRAELDRRDYPVDDRTLRRPMLGGRDDRMYGDYREPVRDSYRDDYREVPPSGAVGRLPGSDRSGDRVRVSRPRPSKRGGRSLSIAPATWDEGPAPTWDEGPATRRPPRNDGGDGYSPYGGSDEGGSRYDSRDYGPSEPPPLQERPSESSSTYRSGPTQSGRYDQDDAPVSDSGYSNYRPVNLGNGEPDDDPDNGTDRYGSRY